MDDAFYATADEFIEDMRLIYNNAILYNGESSEVGAAATDTLILFEVCN